MDPDSSSGTQQRQIRQQQHQEGDHRSRLQRSVEGFLGQVERNFADEIDFLRDVSDCCPSAAGPQLVPVGARPLGTIEKVLEYRPLRQQLQPHHPEWSCVEVRRVEPSAEGPVEYRHVLGPELVYLQQDIMAPPATGWQQQQEQARGRSQTRQSEQRHARPTTTSPPIRRNGSYPDLSRLPPPPPLYLHRETGGGETRPHTGTPHHTSRHQQTPQGRHAHSAEARLPADLLEPYELRLPDDLQRELQRELDHRQRRRRSQSVSSASRERKKSVSPDKQHHKHHHHHHHHEKRHTAKQQQQLPEQPKRASLLQPPLTTTSSQDKSPTSVHSKLSFQDDQAITTTTTTQAKPRAKSDISKGARKKTTQPSITTTGSDFQSHVPPPEEFAPEPRHTCGLDNVVLEERLPPGKAIVAQPPHHLLLHHHHHHHRSGATSESGKYAKHKMLQQERLELLGPASGAFTTTKLEEERVGGDSEHRLMRSDHRPRDTTTVVGSDHRTTKERDERTESDSRRKRQQELEHHHKREVQQQQREREREVQQREREKQERERVKQERELEAEKQRERVKQERELEAEQQRARERIKQERELEAEQQRARERERVKQELEAEQQRAREREEQQRLEAEQRTWERRERERVQKERRVREKQERERLQREKEALELERRLKEEREREKLEQERRVKEQKERLEYERRIREQQERERARKEQERIEHERARKEQERVRKEQERMEQERQIKELQERKRLEQERLERERREHEQRVKDLQEQERREKERIAQEKREREERERRAEIKRREREERLEQERLEREKQERERLEQLRLEQERRQREELERREQKRRQREEREQRRKEEEQRKEAQRQEELARIEREKEREERDRRLAERALQKLTKEREKLEREEMELREHEQLAKEMAEKERVAREMAEKERVAREMAERERQRARDKFMKASERRAAKERSLSSDHKKQHRREAAAAAFEAGSYINGDVVDNIDVVGASRRSEHRERSWERRRPRKSYDDALSSLAATLPLVDKSGRHLRSTSAASRGRKSSRGSATPSIGAKPRSHSDDVDGHRRHHKVVVEHWPAEPLETLDGQRPDSPFPSKELDHRKTTPSPPCTCVETPESDSGNQETVLEVPVSTSTQPLQHPSQDIMQSWDRRSRESRLSRATTTRTAHSVRSQGYSSLASSAFQMIDNAAVVDDTLSPRPRERSRSRSRPSTRDRPRRSASRSYHYHHDFDRCEIYTGNTEYDIEQHMLSCRCTCEHVGYTGYQTDHKATFPEDRGRGLNGSTRSLASTHPMLGPATALTASAGHYGSPGHDPTRHQFVPDGLSLSSKVHTVILSGLKLRRQHWFFLGCLFIVLILALLICLPLSSSTTKAVDPLITSPEMQAKAVAQVLTEVPLIDGHNDLPWNIRKFVHNKLETVNFTHNLKYLEPWAKSRWSHTDVFRMKQGKIGCQLWVAYAPCGAQHKDAVQVTLEQIDLIKRLVEAYPNHLELVKTADELVAAHAAGKIASLITVESGHSIGTSLAVLRMFHRLGARSLTLTHNCNTPWADCSKVDIPGNAPEHNGLTQFGRTVVEEMNRLGMIVDLSHSSIQTALDTLAVSDAPVIFSHSSAQTLCNSSRNIPDNILRLVAEKKGLVMVNFFSYFLTCSNHSTVNDVIAHLNHIRKVAGIDHVGLGASYDGINSTPSGLEDVSKYPALFVSLLASGTWSLDDLKKLAGLNFLRVLREVEKVAISYSAG